MRVPTGDPPPPRRGTDTGDVREEPGEWQTADPNFNANQPRQLNADLDGIRIDAPRFPEGLTGFLLAQRLLPQVKSKTVSDFGLIISLCLASRM